MEQLQAKTQIIAAITPVDLGVNADWKFYTPCECQPSDADSRDEFLREHFIPKGLLVSFGLYADNPQTPRIVALAGTCQKCGGTLTASRTELSERETSDVIEKLWSLFCTDRPYAATAGPTERESVYAKWDMDPSAQRKQRFLEVFSPLDRATVLEWLSKNTPSSDVGPEKPLNINLLSLILRTLRTRYRIETDRYGRAADEAIKAYAEMKESPKFPEEDAYTATYRFWQGLDADLLAAVGLVRDEKTFRQLIHSEIS